MPTNAEEIASLIGNYTDLKRYFERVRDDIDGHVSHMNSRVAAKEGEVDTFLREAKPELRYIQEFTIGGSTEFFYPVWWAFPDNRHGTSKITICRHYSTNGGSNERPLDPSRPHQAALLLEMEGNATGWNGDSNFLEVKRFSERYNNTASHCAFNMWSRAEAYDDKPLHSGFNGDFTAQCRRASGVFLRGGGLTYRVIKNWVGDISFHDGSHDDRVTISQSSSSDWTVRWFAEPIPFDQRNPPVGNHRAFSAD